ncbi:H-NS family nucleoid-associated regulatory protein [Burkholderia ubonensis]|uniref:H-NS histone family protein n=1 Tax=Burkholderia ubonensis TaxID=101571 RepID=UPI0009B41C69|nr:H-NS histone family protein [Burkholderia ubonensis]
METYAELKAKLDKLNKDAESARKLEVAAVLSAIREAVLTYEIRPEEILPTWKKLRVPDRRWGPRPPKYRNPITGETWSGRGRAPKWLVGRDRNDFLITGPTQ